jgi:hypothetical protein
VILSINILPYKGKCIIVLLYFPANGFSARRRDTDRREKMVIVTSGGEAAFITGQGLSGLTMAG